MIRRPAPAATAVALFGVALALRGVYLEQAAANPLHDSVGSLLDSLYYHQHARAIAGVDAPGDPVGSAPYFLGPLYAYFLAALYAVFPPEPATARAAQAVLGALSCVLVQAIGRSLFDARAGLVAGLLWAGYGFAIYCTGVLLPTLLELTLNLAFVLVLVSGPPTGRRGLAAGVLAGLATAAKTNALLLVPAAVGAVWLARGAPPRAALRTSLALAAGAALAVAPFTARNVLVSGEWVLVNTTGGRNLWKGNGPGANGTYVDNSPNSIRLADGRRVRPTDLASYLAGPVEPRRAVEESAWFTRETLAYASAHPRRALGLLARKLVLFFYFERRYSGLLRLPLPGFGLVASLGLAGAALAWRGRPRSAPLYAVLGVQVASFVLVFVLARYRLVAGACLALFAGWLLVECWDAAVARDRRRLAAPLLLALAAAAFVHLRLPGFHAERGFARAWLELGSHLAERGRHEAAADAFERALRHDDWGEIAPDAGRRAAAAGLARARRALAPQGGEASDPGSSR